MWSLTIRGTAAQARRAARARGVEIAIVPSRTPGEIHATADAPEGWIGDWYREPHPRVASRPGR